MGRACRGKERSDWQRSLQDGGASGKSSGSARAQYCGRSRFIAEEDRRSCQKGGEGRPPVHRVYDTRGTHRKVHPITPHTQPRFTAK